MIGDPEIRRGGHLGKSVGFLRQHRGISVQRGRLFRYGIDSLPNIRRENEEKRNKLFSDESQNQGDRWAI